MGRSGAALAVAAGTAGMAINLFARRAPWRRYPWYLAGLVPGLGGTELSLPLAVAQAATGGLAVRLGAGRSRLGTAGLAAAAGATAGLVGLHRHATAAEPILNQALTDAFGDGWASTAHATNLPPLPRDTELVAARDVRYGHDAPEQVLDIWRRPDLPADAAAGVLVGVHGGSWTGGSKRVHAPHLLRELTARGWVCVNIDYRLGPDNRWPTLITDVKRALAWVHEHIAEYGGDPSFLAITGSSAGGHLAALAALSAGDPAFQPGFEHADTSVQAAVPLYGVYDLTALNDDGRPRLRGYLRRVLFDADLAAAPEVWRDASPTWRLRADAPPMLVVHGDRDEIVSVNQARRFAERARAVSGAPFGYAELPYAHHAFDLIDSTRTRSTVRAVSRFLEAVRDRSAPARRPGCR